MPAASVADTESALDQAKTMVESGDMQGALPLLTTAIEDPGLGPDLYGEAVLLRARCYAETGEIEKAEADLAEAEQGASNEGLMHLVRGIVFQKQGKNSEAKKEFAAARKIDPKLKP